MNPESRLNFTIYNFDTKHFKLYKKVSLEARTKHSILIVVINCVRSDFHSEICPHNIQLPVGYIVRYELLL